MGAKFFSASADHFELDLGTLFLVVTFSLKSLQCMVTLSSDDTTELIRPFFTQKVAGHPVSIGDNSSFE